MWKESCLTKIHQKRSWGAFLDRRYFFSLPYFRFRANKNFIQSSGQSLLHPNLCKSTLFCSLLFLLISPTELYPSRYCYTHCIFMLLFLSGLFYIFCFVLHSVIPSLVWRIGRHSCLHLGNNTLCHLASYILLLSLLGGSSFEKYWLCLWGRIIYLFHSSWNSSPYSLC